MPTYTTPQRPDILIKAKGSSYEKATYNALLQIDDFIQQGYLDDERFKDFSSKSFIEIKEQDFMAKDEKELIDSVIILSKLFVSKRNIQDLKEQARKALVTLNILFEEKEIDEVDYTSIQNSLKLIKKYAVNNLRYKEVLIEAETARKVVEKAVEEPDTKNRDQH
ncbi:MAG: hypothetical protein KME47_07475 [Nodosilinea sp. WJT8-NPBG4]|jgi:hypothetical protein|nr:hypothetical protein [Nodosilinea sp. WJT8-NPBG4]